MKDQSLPTTIMEKKDELVKSVSTVVEKTSEQVSVVATEIGEAVVTTVKKYPLHSALAAGAVGLAVGVMATSKKE